MNIFSCACWHIFGGIDSPLSIFKLSFSFIDLWEFCVLDKEDLKMFSPILCVVFALFFDRVLWCTPFFSVLLYIFNLFGGDYKNNEPMPMKGPGHTWRKALNKCKFLFVRTSFLKQGTQSWCPGTTQRGRGGGWRGVQDGGTHVRLWPIPVAVWQKPSIKMNEWIKKKTPHSK